MSFTHSHIVGCVSRLAKVNEKLKWNEKTNPWKCQCRHVARVWFIYLLSLFAVSPSICNSFQINLFLCVGIADGNRNRRCVFCSIVRNPLARLPLSHLISHPSSIWSYRPHMPCVPYITVRKASIQLYLLSLTQCSSCLFWRSETKYNYNNHDKKEDFVDCRRWFITIHINSHAFRIRLFAKVYKLWNK